MKYLIIDNRMRNFEKDKLKSLGYELIELEKSDLVYEEISSHVDIFTCKIKDKIIIEKSQYEKIASKLKCKNIIKGTDLLEKIYPYDIKYNVAVIGNKAFHNSKYTNKEILNVLKENDIELIDVKQGYTNCSIACIDSLAITSDKGLKKVLEENKIETFFLDYIPEIHLLKNNIYSEKNGFIGGAISKLGNDVIIFGDLEKIDKNKIIREFLENKNYNIIEFKDKDVIDYGGILEIEVED